MATSRKRKRSARASSKEFAATAAAADGEEGEAVWRHARTSLGTLALCASPAGVRRLLFVPEAAAPTPASRSHDEHPAASPAPSPLERQADEWLAQAVA
jgi:hypothetical protein